MRMLRTEVTHRVSERVHRRCACGNPSIQPGHQRRRALVVHVPQAQEERVRACTEQPSCDAEQFVTGSCDVRARGAAAQCDQVRLQTQAIEVVDIQISVTKADAGEHRGLGTEMAVRRNVHDAAVASGGTKHLLGRVVRLESDVVRRDVYGRRLAYVTVHGHRFNDVLVERGYARFLVIPPNTRHARDLLLEELDARRARRGLWGDC